MLIKNAKIVVKDNDTKIVDILIEGNKIVRIADIIVDETSVVFDAKEQLCIPGAIDVHVHLREPGYTHKETIETGTRAAAKGGFTTIMAMPNIVPFPDNTETMKRYSKKIEEDAIVNVIPYACITKGEKGKELVDMKEMKQLGISYFSDDGVGVASIEMMHEAMHQAKDNDAMIVAHTEDMNYRTTYACVHEGTQNKKMGLAGIPSECEWKQVERDLQIALETGCAYHICHMSSKKSVELLREYKAKGANVSGEVTTHHLVLSEDDVENTNHKMNPPLRSKEDKQSLIKGLLDGTIDFIANDHAPHSEEEKNKDMATAPFGIVALETSMSLIYTHFVKRNIFTLEQFVAFTSSKAASRFGFENKGKIAEGYDADIILMNNEVSKINKETFESKGKNTPFHDYTVEGSVVMSMVNGKVVYTKEKGVHV